MKPERQKNLGAKASASLFEPARLKRVMVTAGGTGGHIFPGIAVAQVLMQKSVSVRWVGTDYGLEKDIVPKANIPLHYLPIRALRGKGIRRYLIFPWMLARSLWHALRLVRKTQPQVVLSLGGYASGPLALAAYLCRVPVVIHEQNAAPGLTNRVLAPLATLILSGLPNQFSRYSKYREVGNPVRDSFVALHRRRSAKLQEVSDLASRDMTSRGEPSREVKLLVVGGSQGALKLNQVVPQALAGILEANADINIRVVHQTGAVHLDRTKESYSGIRARADVVGFIDDMAGAYEWADLVVGRAGALTVAEVAAAGVACLFVPLAIAVDDHQTMNARTLADNGGAAIVAEADLDQFEQALSELILDPISRQKMADQAFSQAKVDAAQVAYELLEGLLPASSENV